MGGDVDSLDRLLHTTKLKIIEESKISERNDRANHKSLNYQRRIFHDKRHKLNLTNRLLSPPLCLIDQRRSRHWQQKTKINSRALRSDKTAKITFHNWPSYRHINETWTCELTVCCAVVAVQKSSLDDDIRTHCEMQRKDDVEKTRRWEKSSFDSQHFYKWQENLSHIRSLSSPVIYHFIQWSIMPLAIVVMLEKRFKVDCASSSGDIHTGVKKINIIFHL